MLCPVSLELVPSSHPHHVRSLAAAPSNLGRRAYFAGSPRIAISGKVACVCAFTSLTYSVTVVRGPY